MRYRKKLYIKYIALHAVQICLKKMLVISMFLYFYSKHEANKKDNNMKQSCYNNIFIKYNLTKSQIRQIKSRNLGWWKSQNLSFQRALFVIKR